MFELLAIYVLTALVGVYTARTTREHLIAMAWPLMVIGFALGGVLFAWGLIGVRKKPEGRAWPPR